MNSLGLRINKGCRNVINNGVEAPAVWFARKMEIYFGNMNPVYNQFFVAEPQDQLAVLKNILDSQIIDNVYPSHLIKFLIMLILEVPAKHPIKGFIMRQVLKADQSLQQEFSRLLSEVLQGLASYGLQDFDADIQSICKMSKCIEFPPGIIALEMMADRAVMFFKLTLQMAVAMFCETETSPSYKKDISIHCHETLRLLLLMIQKYQINGCADPRVLDDVTRSTLKSMLLHHEMPMDTKNMCGIVLLRALVLEVGEEAALQTVFGEQRNWLNGFLTNDTERLTIYSGLSTKPILRWALLRVNGVPAIIKVVDDVVCIGERTSANASMTLLVVRTVNALSKYLGNINAGPNVAGPEVAGPSAAGPSADIHNAFGPNAVETIENTLAEKLVLYVHTVIDHSIDNVRNTAGLALGQVARFYSKNGNFAMLKQIMDLGTHPVKRSYFLVAGNILSNLKETPENIVLVIIQNCTVALFIQEVQAAAMACLETIITKAVNNGIHYLSLILNGMLSYLQEKTQQGTIDAPVLEIYDRLVTKILSLLGTNVVRPILDRVKKVEEHDPWLPDPELVRVLVVLRAVQKIFLKESDLTDSSHILLRSAADHPKEEYRILAFSIVVESKKTTKIFTQSDFSFVVYFLKHNLNSQSPNFRQLTNSLLKKFVQRIADSHYVIMRDKRDTYYYDKLIAALRTSCITSVTPSANPGRRCSALQLLYWLDGAMPSARIYTKDQIDMLLTCLEDSYETNKKLALEALLSSSSILLQENDYSISLSFEDILEQASSVKPTDCASAAYKMLLVEQKFMRYLPPGQNILKILLTRLKMELKVARDNVVVAAAQAPMYGLVHCLRKFMNELKVHQTKPFIDNLFITLMDCNKVVAPIINNSSPEGHLPMDLKEHSLVTASSSGSDNSLSDADSLGAPDDGELGTPECEGLPGFASNDEILLPGGRKVSAQMVLLCGWRSVKEVSLLLGDLASNRLISAFQLKIMGEHFIELLSETKHRGAFEQAYVGFTLVLPKLWKSELPELHVLPPRWLSKVIADICSDNNQLSPTRRSAGLPYIIQALVTTELQVNGNGKYFHRCMDWLIDNAGNTRFGADFTPTPYEKDIQPVKDNNQLLDNNNVSFQQKNVHFEQNNVQVEQKNVQFEQNFVPIEKNNEYVYEEIEPNTNPFRDYMERPTSDKEVPSQVHDIATNAVYEEEASTSDESKCSQSTNDDSLSPKSDESQISNTESSNVEEDNSDPAESVSASSVIEVNALHVEIRSHCLNVLRALYRNTNLGEAVSGRVQDGLMVSICGLDAQTWQERNSATLLLNALIVRVFGVQRTKDGDHLSARNKMTARIFFLRYPAMYEFMMYVLEYAEAKERGGDLCHSLFGVLLILSRLYQSALEGTDANFRLCGFVRPVMRCSATASLQTRRLAAKTIASIVPPHLWYSQVVSTLQMVGDVRQNRNYLHGVLLQLSYLLEHAPEKLAREPTDKLERCLGEAFRIVFASFPADPVRYIIRNEMLEVLNKFSMRFNRIVIRGEDAKILTDDLTRSTYETSQFYHQYIVNLMYFTSIIQLKEIEKDSTVPFNFPAAQGGLYQAMETKKIDTLTTVPYEILLGELNYFLIFSVGKIEEEKTTEFIKHLQCLFSKRHLRVIIIKRIDVCEEILHRCLMKIIREHYYVECKKKSLMVLNVFTDTATKVVESISTSRPGAIDDVAEQLIIFIRNSTDELGSVCLQTLINFLTAMAPFLTKKSILNCLRLLLRKSSAANSEEVRQLVMSYIRDNFTFLLTMTILGYETTEMFERRALLWCILMTLLEDDSPSIRDCAALVASDICGQPQVTLSTVAAEALRLHISMELYPLEDRMAMMCLMALYDFHSEVCLENEEGRSNRVFDHNERHNVYLEELTWTNSFGQLMSTTFMRLHSKYNMKNYLKEYLKRLLQHPDYREHFETLCDRNLILFERMLYNSKTNLRDQYWNEKVKHFVTLIE